jgi:hypothetical protein
MFGLLVSLALAPCVLPALAQTADDYSKAVKARFDDAKRRADELIKRQENIVRLLKSSDPKVVQASFDEAVALIEQAINSYDEKSELWKAFDQVDVVIRQRIDNARQKSKEAAARWLPFVREWEERLSVSLKQRTDLKAQLVTARGSLESLKQDKEIFVEHLMLGRVKEAQAEMDRSIKDFEGINQNMKDMVASMGKDVPKISP